MTFPDDAPSRLLSELHTCHVEQWRTRTGSGPDRIQIIASLGKQSNRDVVVALLRIVEGGTATYTPKRARTFWRQLPIQYDWIDQFAAVEALGESGSAEALRFLRRKYCGCRFIQTMHFAGAAQGDEWLPPSDIEAVCWAYPFAPTELRTWLDFHVLLGHTYGSGDSAKQLPTPAAQFRQEVERHLNDRSHMAFKSAISKLQAALSAEDEGDEDAWLLVGNSLIEKEQRAADRPTPSRFFSRGEEVVCETAGYAMEPTAL